MKCLRYIFYINYAVYWLVNKFVHSLANEKLEKRLYNYITIKIVTKLL